VAVRVFFIVLDFKLMQKRKAIFCFSQSHTMIAAFDCIVHTELSDQQCLISSYTLLYICCKSLNYCVSTFEFCMGAYYRGDSACGGLDSLLIVGYTPVENS